MNVISASFGALAKKSSQRVYELKFMNVRELEVEQFHDVFNF